MKSHGSLLLIDVTEVGIFHAGALNTGKLTRVMEFEYAPGSSFLAHFVRYLKTQKLKEYNIRGIALVEGKGSFSATRAAISVLNTLQWTKGVRVAAFDCRAYANKACLYAAIACFSWQRAVRSPLRPIYQGSPNITVPKKKVLHHL